MHYYVWPGAQANTVYPPPPPNGISTEQYHKDYVYVVSNRMHVNFLMFPCWGGGEARSRNTK